MVRIVTFWPFFLNLCYPRKPKSRNRAIVAERQYQSYTNPGIAKINHLIQGALPLPFFLKVLLSPMYIDNTVCHGRQSLK